ncbi:polysulfide reductase NrfD [Pseudonocardia sp. KRD-184]|uniref:Polysulfide reductase NrfD n=1 Tax=Pseudonocardia oceani TaxID=2792013 RepID=A0ABS6UHG4_9PSEU|nr:NrfD/PsrC family molybdoenzyme membrane anchor subunit [Pseudonocardia oceani]MBW0089440.1 polysulfide reductase NrfD [Pseudonocardia oceani]MBW0096446.1 polysulfide reductase NrfD [Pseudonocardia oceani]MBW0108763.1 polysulfide reductase NrfD [Pseudonocardia oceani]MBW0122991.1 polysulfide reductase NrfD [Pseudonocardia oceani]MBW0131264.1 polysulfide reductase NrfD [Pseudonocardia oceani]
MSGSDVTRDGVRGARPDREATTGAVDGQGRRGRDRREREQPMVPRAEFQSYYGKPVLNPPVWESPDVPGYLFLGGLAGASSVLAAGAQLTGRPELARTGKVAAVGGGLLSLVALVHDLGQPKRFLHMLRVFKVTSPMSVGSWLLAGYVPLAGVAAASELTGRLPRVGSAATAGAAALGPAVASYTAALISDTAVPAWHDGHREMPYVFVGSAATAAGGVGLLGAPLREQGPARVLALLGVAAELGVFERMRRRIGMVAEPYRSGRGGRYVRAGEALSVAGAAGAVLGRRSRLASAVSGAALVAASAATRWGIFHGGMESARDPRYTVVPQRERARAREAAAGA